MRNLIMFVFVMILYLSAGNVKAQNAVSAVPDTTKSTSFPSPDAQPDRTAINKDEIPEPLRKTLESPQYKGWDKGTVYRTKNSDTYVLEMKGKKNKTKPYRFDAKGQPIHE